MGLVEIVLFGVPALVALTISLLKWASDGRRRTALFRFAVTFGLEYTPTDPFGLIDHRFSLFDRADAARCENVVWGTWQGVEVKVGELWFKPDPERRRQLFRTARRSSFATVEIPAWLPKLAIRHDPLASISETLLLDRLRFESDVFNRMYRVECEDERFAYKFVDPRMMLWLQEIGQAFPFDFEVSGSKVLVWCPLLKTSRLIPLFGSAAGFVDHIPRLVWNEYGTEPAEGTPTNERSAS